MDEFSQTSTLKPEPASDLVHSGGPLLMLAGVGAFVWAFLFDTSYGDVINLGLQQIQLLLAIVGMTLFLAGTVLWATSQALKGMGKVPKDVSYGDAASTESTGKVDSFGRPR